MVAYALTPKFHVFCIKLQAACFMLQAFHFFSLLTSVFGLRTALPKNQHIGNKQKCYFQIDL